MKTTCKMVLVAFLAAGLSLSCNKKDNDNDPNSHTTYENLNALMEEAGKRQKLYVDIAPVELPDYVKESSDTMMQKIVAFAARIDSTREKAVFPSFASSAGSVKSARINADELLQSMGISSEGDWVEECFMENTPYWFCRSTTSANDGKLEIVFSQQDTPEAWISHIVINGEHTNGVVYEYLMIQYWFTLKDLTYSEYAYSTIFYPNPPCGPDILWRFISEVEGEDAWLHFMGETKSLATHIYTNITYNCDFIEGYHIQTMVKMIIQPDGTVLFETYIYSLSLHDIFKWISYACMEDHSWVQIVYNEDGSVEERTQWPPE